MKLSSILLASATLATLASTTVSAQTPAEVVDQFEAAVRVELVEVSSNLDVLTSNGLQELHAMHAAGARPTELIAFARSVERTLMDESQRGVQNVNNLAEEFTLKLTQMHAGRLFFNSLNHIWRSGVVHIEKEFQFAMARIERALHWMT